MSAFKKIAGLVAGVSAVGVIGVAVAQGVPPNPNITNPALGAGEQTATHTLIGETGVLPWSDQYVQQAATLTKQPEPVAVVTPAQDTQPVAAASSSTDTTTVAQTSTPPADTSSNTQSMGAGPSQDTTPAPRHDRG